MGGPPEQGGPTVADLMGVLSRLPDQIKATIVRDLQGQLAAPDAGGGPPPGALGMAAQGRAT